jgi:hypothetical protein
MSIPGYNADAARNQRTGRIHREEWPTETGFAIYCSCWWQKVCAMNHTPGSLLH